MEREKPIGIFDSGIGGLTVVKKLASTLPNEDIVYFGDTARVPYGSKSNETIVEYSIQDANFLIMKNVKIIVAACNTASSVALQELKKRFDVPIIGMIQAGSELAVQTTKNKKIGVIGTRATVNNNAYKNQIRLLNPSIEVFEKACPLFVSLAEEGYVNSKATYIIADDYLSELKTKGIDTLVLGCTHYPILKDVIQEIIGSNVKLIDSGIAASEILKRELDRIDLHTSKSCLGNQDFFISDISVNFKEVAELFLGTKIEHVSKVDIEKLVKLSI